LKLNILSLPLLNVMATELKKCRRVTDDLDTEIGGGDDDDDALAEEHNLQQGDIPMVWPEKTTVGWPRSKDA
jgi:hypothetical protein